MVYRPPIRVMRISDCRMRRDAFAECCEREPDIELVRLASSGSEGLRTALIDKPDVVIIDTDLPSSEAYDVTDRLKTLLPTTKVILVSGPLSPVRIGQAVKSAVEGYLCKEEPVETLIQAVKRVIAGQLIYSRPVAERLSYDERKRRYVLRFDTPIQSLSSRQLEILRYLARGDSVKEVASKLDLSAKSVASHKYRIMRKVGVNDRVHLTRYAIREGLIEA